MTTDNGIDIKVHRINGKVVWQADGYKSTAEAVEAYAKYERVIPADVIAEVAAQHTATTKLVDDACKKAAVEPSKKDLAVSIYRSMMADESIVDKRGEIISEFVHQLNMSVAGATTYYYTAKKLA